MYVCMNVCMYVESGVSVKCFLEALLVGHEDWVTSVHWMSDPEVSLHIHTYIHTYIYTFITTRLTLT